MTVTDCRMHPRDQDPKGPPFVDALDAFNDLDSQPSPPKSFSSSPAVKYIDASCQLNAIDDSQGPLTDTVTYLSDDDSDPDDAATIPKRQPLDNIYRFQKAISELQDPEQQLTDRTVDVLQAIIEKHSTTAVGSIASLSYVVHPLWLCVYH
ncbi:hypothetical protein ColTof4_14418 [Colletotrichum tofieldiae]|nr:hypothetical protein ColTof3_14862 [Colletotrichum tofieldiae]GKT81995.1 hypothetical protein ColTof4_14418 [Colletotrichum tofieldiae]